MSQDTSPVVNLEVIVPYIVLPAGQAASASTLSTSANPEQSQHGTQEQVRIRPLSQASSDQQEQTGTAATYSTQKGPFRLFRIKDIPATGQPMLLQILRSWQAKHQSANEQDEQHPWISDELVLSCRFLQQDQPAEALQEQSLSPGINQVIILVDKDGIPVSYSIDGAES
jgi:hypothetical protein